MTIIIHTREKNLKKMLSSMKKLFSLQSKQFLHLNIKTRN
jgi:hypothetical protein